MQGEEKLMACKRSLADEKRALEVAERKQKALQKKQAQVAAEAKAWRDKFDTEKAAADADAAAEASCDRAST
jgi:vacuolar-type H+-ATPase subunit D/Vma8